MRSRVKWSMAILILIGLALLLVSALWINSLVVIPPRYANVPTATPTPTPFGMPTPVGSASPFLTPTPAFTPTPQPTFAYTAPTPVGTAAPFLTPTPYLNYRLFTVNGGTPLPQRTVVACPDATIICVDNAGAQQTELYGVVPTPQPTPTPAPTSIASVYTLLYSGSGNSATQASGVEVDSYALASQLAAQDRLLIYIGVTQNLHPSNLISGATCWCIYNKTDTVKMFEGDAASVLATNDLDVAVIHFQAGAGSTTKVEGAGVLNRNGAGTVNVSLPVFTTAWTGAWTVSFRIPGNTALGGTTDWQWSIYKVTA